MKFIKTLAAAAVLAAVSTTPAVAGLNAISGGLSEVYFVVGDQNGSFLLDTGITYDEMFAAASNGTLNLSRSVAGAEWNKYLASDANLFDGATNSDTGTRWALFVYEGAGNFDLTNLRVLSTVGMGVSAASIGATWTGSFLNTIYNSTSIVAVGANGTGTHNTTLHGESFNAKGTVGYLDDNFFRMGPSANTFIGNKVGDSSTLVSIIPTDPEDDLVPVNAFAFNNVTVSFDGGTLSVTAVPEPQTYALMLGGLAAVGFIARRRRSV